MADTDVVLGFWGVLYKRDWDAIPDFFTDDALYFDVPTGPTTGAFGGEGVRRRLMLGIESLTDYTHDPGQTFGDGNGNVVTEHKESWTFPTGEHFTIEFVSVMKVVDGKIREWRDYWDYRVWEHGVPADYTAAMVDADLSFLPTPEQLAIHGF